MKKAFLLMLLQLMLLATYSQAGKGFSVYFAVDEYAITTAAAATLDSFLAADKSTSPVKLFGYCDVSAGFAYNDVLSMKRVKAVKQYLAAKGFKAGNIAASKGYGKRRLINKKADEPERSLNRRVDIITVDTELQISNEALTATGKTLTEQMTDTQTTAAKNIILRNLNFYGGTHRVLPESMPVLEELLSVLKKNPSLEIFIKGHICCQEGPGDGMDIETGTMNLSGNRAKEIYNYLQRNGIASSRLRYQGFGHQFPLTASIETTEEERTANRRVEIQIIKR